MVEPDDVITRYGEPISPMLSAAIGLTMLGIGVWFAYRTVSRVDETKFSARDAVMAGFLVMLWFAASGSGAIAIGSKQAELVALGEIE